ncbi:MAG: alpha/beta hydrolase [Spirochaetia bacterium]|nr:alpha/beta hydrolase [Spirochaetia bacterium]
MKSISMRTLSRRTLPALALCLFSCFPYSSQIQHDREAILKGFPDSSRTYEFDGKNHYMRTGTGKDLLVFIHGSPGSWDSFAGFLNDSELATRARMISVDRPGFGQSTPGIPEPSLEKQALRIRQAILKEKGTGRVILVGHSFGGPLIAKLAMLDPDSYHALIFVAASVDPDLEIVHWYQNVGSWKVIQAILPQDLDVTNREILPLRQELIQLLPLWKNIKCSVSVIQGLDDTLVPPGNADFIEKQLPQARIIRVPGLNHFVPWARPDLVKKEILRELGGI